MVSREEAVQALDQDEIKVKSSSNTKAKAKAGASAQSEEIVSLFDYSDVEDRSEVISLRITPSARQKLESIWLEKRKSNKKLKESTIAADILIKVLEKY